MKIQLLFILIGLAVTESSKAHSDDLSLRVQRLEQAVLDLQFKVKQLGTDSTVYELYECSIEAFASVYSGQGTTLASARSITRNECLKKHASMFCDIHDIRCIKLR